MSYQVKILVLSFFVSIIVSLIILPILRKLKVGQIERTEGPQSHLKKQGTPTMGRNNYDHIYYNHVYSNVYRIYKIRANGS